MPNVFASRLSTRTTPPGSASKTVLLGLETVWLEAECSRYEFFVDVVEQTKPDIGFIAMDSDPPRAIKLVSETLQKAPGLRDPRVEQLDRRPADPRVDAGRRQGVPHRAVRLEDLIAALERVRRQAVRRRAPRARITARSSPSPAPPAAWARPASRSTWAAPWRPTRTNSVVLVDLDLALGDADVFLDTIPDYTLADVAQNVERLDLTLLKQSLTKHSSGLYLLPRPVQLEDVRLITPTSCSA